MSKVAANLEVRAILIDKVRDAIKKHGGTQTEVAKELGVAQSKISYLMNSRIDKFSVEALVTFLALLGYGVSFKVIKTTWHTNNSMILLFKYLVKH